MEWISEHVIELAALILSLLSAWKAHLSEKKAEEAKKKAYESEAELRRIQEDFDASEKYGQVKMLERLFEDALAELVTVTDKDSNATKDDIKRALLVANNRYTDFYNEINSFCKLINDGSIKAEGYLRDTACQKLIDHANLQWEYYEELNIITAENQMKKLNRPRHNAFKAYDEFLKNHLSPQRWENIKENRRRVGMT